MPFKPIPLLSSKAGAYPSAALERLNRKQGSMLYNILRL
jgi:hypothetical protein